MSVLKFNLIKQALYLKYTILQYYSLQHLKEQWEGDFDTELFEEIWQKAIQRIHTSSICVRHGLLQFNYIPAGPN